MTDSICCWKRGVGGLVIQKIKQPLIINLPDFSNLSCKLNKNIPLYLQVSTTVLKLM